MLKNTALLFVYALTVACGAPLDPGSDTSSDLDEGELAALEAPLTSQTTANSPHRISGITAGCSPVGAACTDNMPTSCTCLVPADKTVTFSILREVFPLRERVQQILTILNNKYAARGWTFTLNAPGVLSGEVIITNGSVPDAGQFDVRSYTTMVCNGPTLSEPTAIPGTFKAISSCGLTVDLNKILVNSSLLNGNQGIMARHALMHSMVKTIGLGLTGNSGDAATGVSMAFNSEKTGTVAGQDCLVNNYSVTSGTQISLSNSANCPGFPAGM